MCISHISQIKNKFKLKNYIETESSLQKLTMWVLHRRNRKRILRKVLLYEKSDIVLSLLCYCATVSHN